jgi:ParB-like chromosome segregation protein Spo0J
MESQFIEIPLTLVRPGRFQPRQNFEAGPLLELASSIREQGLLDPVVIFLNQAGFYELIGGERRWRASLAGAIGQAKGVELAQAVEYVEGTQPAGYWELLFKQEIDLSGYTIMAHLQPGSGEGDEQLKAVVHNLQREDLSRLEQASAFQGLRQQYGWSIREVAARVGKSRGYVEDTLKLLGLAPEVAAMLAGAPPAVEEEEGAGVDLRTGPPAEDAPAPKKAEPAPLDLSLARELARSIPKEMQATIAGFVRTRAAKGEPVATLARTIRDIARFIQPNRWSLSDGAIYPPVTYNRARFIRHLLKTLPGEQLAQRVLGLVAVNSYDSNLLSRQPSKLLEKGYDYGKIAHQLAGKESPEAVWLDLANVEGWTCGYCAMAPLAKEIAKVRDAGLDGWMPPCERLKDPQVTTCAGFVGPDDPQIIPVQSTITRYIQAPGPVKELLKGPLQDDSRSYVTTWQEYIHVYNRARIEREQREAQEQEANKLAHLPAMRAYWEAQGEGSLAGESLFDLGHFQAHACRKCARFIAGETTHGVPCELAEQPQVKQGTALAPDFGVLVAEDGRAVPRCQKFSYRQTPAIQRSLASGSKIADRELLLSWYTLLAGNRSSYGASKFIWRPLRWLPGSRDLAALWVETNDDDIMLTLLNCGILEALAAANYGETNILPDPVMGGAANWRVMRWNSFTGRTKPYGWDERPLPWEKKPKG